jgi:hypothetical protein
VRACPCLLTDRPRLRSQLPPQALLLLHTLLTIFSTASTITPFSYCDPSYQPAHPKNPSEDGVVQRRNAARAAICAEYGKIILKAEIHTVNSVKFCYFIEKIIIAQILSHAAITRRRRENRRCFAQPYQPRNQIRQLESYTEEQWASGSRAVRS